MRSIAGAIIFLTGTTLWAAEKSVQVGDAYVRCSDDGQRWSIGTRGVEMAFEAHDGRFRTIGFQNKLVNPPLEYVDAKTASSPFLTSSQPVDEKYTIESLWAKPLVGPITLDPAADNLRITVKKGDRIGFSVGPHGDHSCDHLRWPVTVDYGDGEKYDSAGDAKVEQGPVWFYAVRMPNTGCLWSIDAVEFAKDTQQNYRIPSEQSGYRSPGMTPHIGPTVMHPSNEHDAVRIWRAPKDGTVTIRGKAEHIGAGDKDLSVLKIAEKPTKEDAPVAVDTWTLKSAKPSSVSTGGRPAVQLDFVLVRDGLQADFHILAFPGTPILRHWLELENTGMSTTSLHSPAPASLILRGNDATAYTSYRMVGGNSQTNQGNMESTHIASPHHHALNGYASLNWVPWTAYHRKESRKDGWFVALEFLGRWSIATDHDATGPLEVKAVVSELRSRQLKPGEKLGLPVVTIGAFKDYLDDMAKWVYDWQYEYLWDYTNDEWYALMQITTAWWHESRNLQEQFAGRLAYLDMDWVEYMREAGMDVLWDDAGWAANPNIWIGNREGPDFAHTVRFVTKSGMKWCLWFPGDPGSGIMDTKVGSWGNFQWRTDGLGFNFDFDKAFRQEVTRHLRMFPRSSWQTCSGGSTYAHMFDIQRYGDVHYDSDGPGSDITNYYFSYLDTPDKWFDNLATWSGARGIFYDPYTGRRMLTMVPKWGLYIWPSQIDQMRFICDLYRYIFRQGVAGRWSYITHPAIKGDTEHYYLQRVSYDRKRSMIVLKHKAPGEVTIYPRGLLAEHAYQVEFDSGRPGATRNGADLITNGIAIKDQAPGELIYLNLPDRPGSGRDKVAPKAPGRVLSRRESNMGFCGVGLYWSPGTDNNWLSRYEVRRNTEVLGRTCTGTYFFDRSLGWDPKAAYSVRTVDGDGNVSEWTTASPMNDEPLAYAVMGGHSSQWGREGWRAETTGDLRTFYPMSWVPPARLPSADLGGTPNQSGGAEGYWEGDGGARVGRGWQLASTSCMGARTWVAPKSGSVQVTGRAMKEYYHRDQGGPLRVRILHNDRQIWPADGWATIKVGDLTGLAHNLALQVAAGDAIRFVLDKGTAPEHDLLAWMPRIVQADGQVAGQPATSVRILCGAKEAYTDRTGNVWSADQDFTGGEAFSTTASIAGATPTPEDQALYQVGRVGKDFTYAIPVAPGLYSLRLKLTEPKYEWFFQRPFNLDINGRRILTNSDTCQAARGPRRAHERVFRYLVPDAEGRIVFRFTSGWEPAKACDEAIVQAIEILPEDKSVIRIDAGTETEFIDWAGFTWRSDTGFDGGQTLRSNAPVTQASPTLYDQALYRTARTGKGFSYTFAVTPGLYTVHLKFAELWLKEAGRRPMDIEVNGRVVWKSWDPATAAGRLGMAADVRVEDIAPDKDGRITIRLKAVGENDAILQGIEIE